MDTNVLVRYIAQDDSKQSPKATRLIEALTSDAPGYVSLVSVVELVWVLTGCYTLTRSEICEVLETLLRTKALSWRMQILYGITFIKEGKADFADCLIERSANEAGCNYTTTFDRDAAKHCGMQLIE